MNDTTRVRKWIDIRDVIAVALVTVASFVVETTLGLFLIPLVSIPLVGGLLSGFFDAIIMFTGAYLVPRRGSALLFGVLLLTMSTVTPSFGPPSPWKILIGFGIGIPIEVMLLIVGRSVPAYVSAIAVAFGLSIPMTYLVWVRFGIPGADKLKPYLLVFSIVYAVLGAIGAGAGAWLFNTRLSRYSSIKKLRQGI